MPYVVYVDNGDGDLIHGYYHDFENAHDAIDKDAEQNFRIHNFEPEWSYNHMILEEIKFEDDE